MRAEQAEERALDGYFGDRPDALKDRDYDRAHGVFLSQLGQLRQAMNNECYGTVAALMPLTPVRRDPVLDPLQSGLPDTASIHDSLTGLGITIDLRPFKGTLADIRRIELADAQHRIGYSACRTAASMRSGASSPPAPATCR